MSVFFLLQMLLLENNPLLLLPHITLRQNSFFLQITAWRLDQSAGSVIVRRPMEQGEVEALLRGLTVAAWQCSGLKPDLSIKCHNQPSALTT